MIVLDAGALAEFLLERGLRAEWVAARMEDESHAPHLIDFEVTSVVRRRTLRREISHERGATALADLQLVSLTRYPAGALLPRIWELRNNLSAYDAAYIALAEALDAPFVTTDARLARARGHRALVETFRS